MSTTSNLQPKRVTLRVQPSEGSSHDAIEGDCIGDSDLLTKPAIGLFCSSECPGSAILASMKWIGRASDFQSITIAAGFHSAMEKGFLEVLLMGRCSTLVFPARSLTRYRVPESFRQPIVEHRLAIVSCFPDSVHSATASTGRKRNQLVADFASHIVVAYAAPGSSTEAFALKQLEAGGQVYCIHSECTSLMNAGAEVLPDQFDADRFGGLQ